MSDVASRLSELEQAELAALADGTLPVDRRAAVEARVAASPELQRLLERQRHSVAATQALADEPVPASLRVAVEGRSRGRGAGRGRSRWLVARLGTAGALAAVFAVVAAVFLGGGPGTPTVAEAAPFAGEAPTGPAPTRWNGRDEAGDPGRRSRVPGPAVVRLAGGRRVHGRARRPRHDERPLREGRARIAYAVVAGDGLPRPSAADETTRERVLFQTLRVDGRLVVTWRRLGHTCVLIGDASPSELLALASWRGNGTLRY